MIIVSDILFIQSCASIDKVNLVEKQLTRRSSTSKLEMIGAGIPIKVYFLYHGFF